MDYFTNNRIRWFISAAVSILCGVAVFLPAVNVADVLGVSETESHSLVWFLSEAGFPEVYTVVLTVYFVFLLPLVVCGFLKNLRVWPIVTAAVASIVYFAVNIFWTAIILGGSGQSGAVTLSVWGWVYLVVQTGAIINLFAFIPRCKVRNKI